jgi:hypothetical protein
VVGHPFRARSHSLQLARLACGKLERDKAATSTTWTAAGMAGPASRRWGLGMGWGIGDPAVHDEVVISAALVSVSDELPWAVEVPGQVVAAGDHLARLDRGRRGW